MVLEHVVIKHLERRRAEGWAPPAPPQPGPRPSLGGSRDGDRPRDLSRISLKYLLSTISPTSDLPPAERLKRLADSPKKQPKIPHQFMEQGWEVPGARHQVHHGFTAPDMPAGVGIAEELLVSLKEEQAVK